MPLEITVQTLDINGFFAKEETGYSKFLPPCLFYSVREFGPRNESAPSGRIKEELSKNLKQQRMLLIFLCVPVSPGNSRMISEHKINDAGPINWQKVSFVPTKADAMVIAFRMWLRKYSGGQVDWGTKFSGYLPPTPPKEQLMDRYQSHVLNCSSCRKALKGLKALEVTLQVISVSIGIVAALKQDVMPMATKVVMVSMAMLFFATSKWLSHFIYKNFYFHDYNHALRKKNLTSAFVFGVASPSPSK
ncbi:Protochlorophyllide-dependent translocon component 52 protein [Thalictrum thalictroides]|uniref:Protochlorophyllide-dependent translocon component 52 protein n=1 Tax=Thalictrum thalictroides TaxID=46969 RepID=A0A7J6VTS9_THATH|nr:Protochlorophyllide-dependent translocon component 52 protein [Thalictrum thalictroides]